MPQLNKKWLIIKLQQNLYMSELSEFKLNFAFRLNLGRHAFWWALVCVCVCVRACVCACACACACACVCPPTGNKRVERLTPLLLQSPTFLRLKKQVKVKFWGSFIVILLILILRVLGPAAIRIKESHRKQYIALHSSFWYVLFLLCTWNLRNSICTILYHIQSKNTVSPYQIVWWNVLRINWWGQGSVHLAPTPKQYRIVTNHGPGTLYHSHFNVRLEPRDHCRHGHIIFLQFQRAQKNLFPITEVLYPFVTWCQQYLLTN